MTPPAVSIIIPTYNRPELLREALDSVAAQTFRDYEVIVVDDGSTPPIADAVEDHPVRPKIIRQNRQGPGAARNRGIAEAKAEIVAFLDSDDLWMPTKLERFVGALRDNPAVSIFYGPMTPIDASRQEVSGRTKPRHSGRITEALFNSCFVDVPTVVCRKNVLKRAGGFDATLPVCEDYDLWLRVSLTEPFGLIEEPLAKRRLHDDRLSKSTMGRNFAIRAQTLLRFYENNKRSGALSEGTAHPRLARAFFVAGRAALREGDYSQAIDMFRTSRSFRRGALRPLMLQIAASACFRFAGPSPKPELAAAPAPLLDK
ncbi:MAG TPA: glycosyltransferase [Phycisphaerae bacterium]|nr:glycosyltransferase [Phycisphaerae bacterium]